MKNPRVFGVFGGRNPGFFDDEIWLANSEEIFFNRNFGYMKNPYSFSLHCSTVMYQKTHRKDQGQLLLSLVRTTPNQFFHLLARFSRGKSQFARHYQPVLYHFTKHVLSYTVDGTYPAPVDMVNIPLSTQGFIQVRW